ncbi:MAG: PH domain-containing protein [Erysipelotrichaceae bacterium]
MNKQFYSDNKRIKVKRDVWVTLAMFSILAVFIMSIIIVPSNERLIVILLVIPVSIFLGSIYFWTYYVFKENVLVCQNGPFREKISYDKIKSLKLCKNFMSSMALSRERIEIRQHGKGYITGTTYISPVDREQFIIELKQRCTNLDDQNQS